MSWMRKYSFELQRRRDVKRAALTALKELREKETREALGFKEPTTPRKLKEGDLIGHKKTRGAELIDIVVSPEPLVIRRYTRGRSKYYPAQEDRKHAKALAGGRLERVGSFARRLRNRLIGIAGSAILAPVPSGK